MQLLKLAILHFAERSLIRWLLVEPLKRPVNDVPAGQHITTSQQFREGWKKSGPAGATATKILWLTRNLWLFRKHVAPAGKHVDTWL